MDEHIELVSEIPDLEKLSAQARLDRAKERRLSQLQRWDKRSVTEDIFPPVHKKSKSKGIRFQPNITLIEASARNDAEEVVYLVKNGFSPDLQNEDGLSALHQAVIEDCEDVVHALVENGASLDIKDADLWTPLHAAVACANFDLVSYLVEKGASLVEINADGNMPIDLCEDNEDIEKLLDNTMAKEFSEEELENIRNAIPDEMLKDLRDSVIHGRSLTIADANGGTAMHVAAANGYLEVIEYLIEHEVAVDMKDNDGWQPIHAAACWGQDKAIELLFQHGADLDAKTNLGETPFDLSEDDDLVDMMQELKQNGRKTKELKRSQSNSSRTLCVRRSSIVDKHRMSLNDAKSEGMILQSSPDYKEVYLHADPDAYPMGQHVLRSEVKQHESIQGTPLTTNDISKKGEEKKQSQEPQRTSHIKDAEETSRVEGQDRRLGGVNDEKAKVPESSVTITINSRETKTEFRKETTSPTKTTAGLPQPDSANATGTYKKISDDGESAPIAKRESDAPKHGTQSPSDVTVTIADSPALKQENSSNSKNTAARKPSSSESKGNGLPKKKCCIIL